MTAEYRKQMDEEKRHKQFQLDNYEGFVEVHVRDAVKRSGKTLREDQIRNAILYIYSESMRDSTDLWDRCKEYFSQF
jgi:hypothetical protein